MTTDLESVETLLAPLLVDGNGGEAVAGLVLHYQRGLPSKWPPLNTNHKIGTPRREIITVRGQSYVSRLPKY